MNRGRVYYKQCLIGGDNAQATRLSPKSSMKLVTLVAIIIQPPPPNYTSEC